MIKRMRSAGPMAAGIIAAALLMAPAAAGATPDAGATTADAGVGPSKLILDSPAASDGGAPTNVTVWVDETQEPFGVELPLAPGEHRVRFVYANGVTVYETVLITAGALVHLSPPASSSNFPEPPARKPLDPPTLRTEQVHAAGCCGGAKSASRALDLRALGAVAFGLVVLGGRRRRPR